MTAYKPKYTKDEAKFVSHKHPFHILDASPYLILVSYFLFSWLCKPYSISVLPGLYACWARLLILPSKKNRSRFSGADSGTTFCVPAFTELKNTEPTLLELLKKNAQLSLEIAERSWNGVLPGGFFQTLLFGIIVGVLAVTFLLLCFWILAAIAPGRMLGPVMTGAMQKKNEELAALQGQLDALLPPEMYRSFVRQYFSVKTAHYLDVHYLDVVFYFGVVLGVALSLFIITPRINGMFTNRYLYAYRTCNYTEQHSRTSVQLTIATFLAPTLFTLWHLGGFAGIFLFLTIVTALSMTRYRSDRWDTPNSTPSREGEDDEKVEVSNKKDDQRKNLGWGILGWFGHKNPEPAPAPKGPSPEEVLTEQLEKIGRWVEAQEQLQAEQIVKISSATCGGLFHNSLNVFAVGLAAGLSVALLGWLGYRWANSTAAPYRKGVQNVLFVLSSIEVQRLLNAKNSMEFAQAQTAFITERAQATQIAPSSKALLQTFLPDSMAIATEAASMQILFALGFLSGLILFFLVLMPALNNRYFSLPIINVIPAPRKQDLPFPMMILATTILTWTVLYNLIGYNWTMLINIGIAAYFVMKARPSKKE